MQNKNIIIVIVVALVAAGAGFFGGMKYQQSQKPTFAFQGANGNRMIGQNFPAGSGMRGQNGGRGQGFRPVLGEIIAQDDKTITVKLQDGSSKIINVADSTTINKSDAAAKSDLTKGQTVSVFGTENSDGSVTANNIQLNPQMRIMQSPAPSQSPEQK